MTITCDVCAREIHVGHDCWRVSKGVLGTRDFIDLEHRTFCSTDCLEAGFDKVNDDDEPEWRSDRRVP